MMLKINTGVFLYSRRGQTLAEILIGMTIGIALIMAGIGLIVPSLNVTKNTTNIEKNATFAKELLDNVRVWSEGDWHGIQSITPGPSSHYYLNTSSSPFAVVSGDENIVVSTTTYTRYFYVSNGYRDISGNLTTDVGTGINDPSTKQVTVVFGVLGGTTSSMSTYLTRYSSNIYMQTDWSGGPVAATMVMVMGTGGVSGYAWNDAIGWINFGYASGSVAVSSTKLTGYAYNDNIKEIALDCATSPAGNMCSTSTFKVNYSSSTGDLSGYAWNDTIGWISFNCSDAGLCTNSNYKVNINKTTGVFTGWAWNDAVGWISFNCADAGVCGASSYQTNLGSSSSSVFAAASTVGNQFTTSTNIDYTSMPGSIKISGLASGAGISTSSVSGYAWNDSIGWIDFGYATGTITIGSAGLTGYAYNNNVKEIALDCATSPVGNLCGSSNFRVIRDYGTGDLSGGAWNDTIGWISFNCADAGLCGVSNYKVNVSPTTGVFTGAAWNDLVGWISFNCADAGICGSSNYFVKKN